MYIVNVLIVNSVMVMKDERFETEKPKTERELILEDIRSLEGGKKELIDKVKKLNEKKKLKSLELKAMEPYLAEKRNVSAGPLIKRLKGLEFRLSQTINPKSEKDLVKEITILEKELRARLKIERMRKRKGYLESDLEKIDQEIQKVNDGLKDVRDDLKDRRTSFKTIRKKPNTPVKIVSKDSDDGMLALEDLVEIEKK